MIRLVAAVVLLLAATTTACSTGHSSADFCDKLVEVTGPGGVESALQPGDPARIDGVVQELTELHARAPEEIATTTRTLLTFFETYQRAPRNERRDVIAANAQDLSAASEALDDYALDECGLFLDRVVPTPLPTADRSIEVPITD